MALNRRWQRNNMIAEWHMMAAWRMMAGRQWQVGRMFPPEAQARPTLPNERASSVMPIPN